MKIKEVRSLAVEIPLPQPVSFSTRTLRSRQLVLVFIRTDEGVEGTGYAYGGPLIKHAVDLNLAPLLVGQDPTKRDSLWDLMFRDTLLLGRRGAVMRAISAVDIALWDITGKLAEKPIYALLGATTASVPAYASGGYYREGKGPKELAEEAVKYVRAGFDSIKIKVGRLSPQEDADRLAAARRAVGPEVKIAIDANNAWEDAKRAIDAFRHFEPYDVWWFEEPVFPDQIQECAEVADNLEVPVATGEIECTRWGFRELIHHRAADILQPDVAVLGGVSEWLKVSDMAERANIPLAPHWNWHIHAHLVAASRMGIVVEYFDLEEGVFPLDRLLYDPWVPKNGRLQLPSIPGHGIRFNMKAAEAWRIA